MFRRGIVGPCDDPQPSAPNRPDICCLGRRSLSGGRVFLPRFFLPRFPPLTMPAPIAAVLCPAGKQMPSWRTWWHTGAPRAPAAPATPAAPAAWIDLTALAGSHGVQAEELGLDLSEHGESMLAMTSKNKVHPLFDATDTDVAYRP